MFRFLFNLAARVTIYAIEKTLGFYIYVGTTSAKWLRSHILASARPQHFSLPAPIMSYIVKNQSSKLYQKLIRTYKMCIDDKSHHPYWIILRKKSTVWNLEAETKKLNGYPYSIDLPNTKIWLTNSYINVDSYLESSTSCLLRSVQRCDITKLILISQKLTFNDMSLLLSSGKVKDLLFIKSVILNDDGSPALLEDILEMMPEITKFIYFPKESFTLSPQKLKTLRPLRKLKTFAICNLEGSIDASAVSTFIRNTPLLLACSITFKESVLEADKERLRDALLQEYPNSTADASIIGWMITAEHLRVHLW